MRSRSRTATACTSRPTPARRGRTSASTTRSRSAASPSIRRTRTSSSSRRSATSTAPNPDRGVFRSRDGGATWQKVLFKNDNVGAIDVAFDPANSQIVYASLWNTRRPPWNIYPPSNGPGSGLFKSTDGGTTWKPLTSGLPTEGVGRIGIAVAPDQSARASTRSSTRRKAASSARTTPARRWRRCRATRASGAAAGTSARSSSIRRTPTSSTCRTPASIARATAARRSASRSRARPAATTTTSCGSIPDDGNRMILGGDQGAVISVDGLTEHPTWSSWLNQPIAQIYHVAADNRVPVLGDRRAAGQRRGARALARPVRRHHHARLGAAVRRRRERLHRARSAASGDRLRRHGDALQRRDRQDARTSRPKWICRRRRATPGRSRSSSRRPIRSALYFATSILFKTTDGGEDLDADQRRPDAREPGVPPNLDAATAADAPAQPSGRRHLHDRAVAAPRAAALDRHRRRLHPRHAGRRQDVAERDAARRRRVEQGRR